MPPKGNVTDVSHDWLLRLSPDDGTDALRPATTTAFATAISQLGEAPARWAVEVVAACALLAEEALDEHPVGPADSAAARRASEASLLTVLRGLHHGVPAAELTVPDEVLLVNRRLQQRGVPLEHILRHAWVQHSHAYAELIGRMGLLVPPGELADESRRVAKLSFSYIDAFTSLFAEDYRAEALTLLNSGHTARWECARRIIAGEPTDVAEAERTLGLNAARQHLGVIMWTDDLDALAGEPGLRVAAELGRAARSRSTTVIPAGQSEVWLWCSWPDRPEVDLAETLRQVAVPTGVQVAVGPVLPGLEGFRRSHLAAREVVRLARSHPRPDHLHDYRDLAVVALLTADAEHARHFMHRVLGKLAGDGPRLDELRETLRLYVAYGRSRSRAATRLHISRNTVAYRVQQAEQLLGHAVPEDPLDLRTALELAGTLLAPG